ncbi:HEPN domain-containing protein [Hyalangium gracile]|uniref:HEPN domain-containing protein n=1 Tax=Hyalangium gracile TaxID=394092 RepID=UPI001CC963F0|nr:HEPN domain-containing protein [Hyalangium gracile]
MEAIESAVESFLKQASFRALWDEKEVWGVVASMVATLPMDADEQLVRDALGKRLERLTLPGPTVVVFPVSHVGWKGPPLVVGQAVLGRLGREWMTALEGVYGSPVSLAEAGVWWWEKSALAEMDASREPPVVIAVVVPSAGERAHKVAETVFEDLVELSLLFEPNLESRGLYSLRGDVFRPGIRGLRVDRHALESIGKTCKPVLNELAASIYIQSRVPGGTRHYWYGEDPWPLEDLLQDDERRANIVAVMSDQGPIARRFRISAKWYARAYWSSSEHESILALGIALEALLGESGGGPGAILGERYALLHSNPDERKQAYDYFMKKIYEGRSAVAHGRASSLLDDFQFVRDVVRRTAWVANSLWAWVKERNLQSDEDHRKLFSDLKWGVKPSNPMHAKRPKATPRRLGSGAAVRKKP